MLGAQSRFGLKRRTIAFLAGALLIVLPGLASASDSVALSGHPSSTTTGSHGLYRAQVVYRVGRATSTVGIDIAATAHDNGFWWVVELQRSGRHWDYPDRQGSWAESDGLGPVVYGTPIGTTPACPVCTTPVAMPLPDHGTFKSDPSSIFYVISENMDMVVTTKTPGWRVKEAPAPTVHRVFGEDATATGVRTWVGAVEHFTYASVTSGKYGSAVFASLPCQNGGVGSALLTGGPSVRNLQCGLTTYGGADWDTGIEQPTTWRLKGDATGSGIWQDRLLVFDFPNP